MSDILKKMIVNLGQDWSLDIDQKVLVQYFEKNIDLFPNSAGDIETLVMNCKMTHASRIIGKNYSHKKIIIKDDFIKAFDKFNTTKNKVDANYEYIRKTFYS